MINHRYILTTVAFSRTALLLSLARQDTVVEGVAELKSDLRKRRAQQEIMAYGMVHVELRLLS
jgi:hypothetical protein